MTSERKQKLTEQVDWALKITAALSPIAIAAGLYWLSQYFVTRSEYMDLRPKVERIEQTLIRMESQQKQLDDHEMRLRILEARR